MKRKLYIAFRLPKAIEEEAITRVQTRVAPNLTAAQPAKADRMHVTLCFLGIKSLEEGTNVLNKVRDYLSFEAQITGTGRFSSRVLYHSLTTDGGHTPIVQTLAKAAGVRPTSGLHLTLAKMDGRGEDPAISTLCDELNGVKSRTFTVGSLGLYCKSELLASVQLKPFTRADIF